MKFYATYIRKVTEDDFRGTRANQTPTDRRSRVKRAKTRQDNNRPQAVHLEKYLNFMKMLDEKPENFPRVSELSRRVEDEKRALTLEDESISENYNLELKNPTRVVSSPHVTALLLPKNSIAERSSPSLAPNQIQVTTTLQQRRKSS